MAGGRASRFVERSDDEGFGMDDFDFDSNRSSLGLNSSKGKKSHKKSGKGKRSEIVDLRIPLSDRASSASGALSRIVSSSNSEEVNSMKGGQHVFDNNDNDNNNCTRDSVQDALSARHIATLEEMFSSTLSFEEITSTYIEHSCNFEASMEVLLDMVNQAGSFPNDSSKDPMVGTSHPSYPTVNNASEIQFLQFGHLQSSQSKAMAEQETVSPVNAEGPIFECENFQNEVNLWDNFPQECKEIILSHLDFRDLCRIAATCQEFAAIVRKQRNATSYLILPYYLNSFACCNLVAGYQNLTTLSFRKLGTKCLNFAQIFLSAAGVRPPSVKPFDFDNEFGFDAGENTNIYNNHNNIIIDGNGNSNSGNANGDLSFSKSLLLHSDSGLYSLFHAFGKTFLRSNPPYISFRSLICVDLSNCKFLQDSDIVLLCNLHFALEELNLSGCPLITDISLYAISDYKTGKNFLLETFDPELSSLTYHSSNNITSNNNSRSNENAREVIAESSIYLKKHELNVIKTSSNSNIRNYSNDNNTNGNNSNKSKSNHSINSSGIGDPTNIFQNKEPQCLSKDGERKGDGARSPNDFIKWNLNDSCDSQPKNSCSTPSVLVEKRIDNLFGQAISQIPDSSQERRGIRRLDISKCKKITRFGLQKVLSNKDLESLDVSHCVNLNQDGFEISAQSKLTTLKSSSLPLLTKISLRLPYISTFSELSFSNCSSLKELILDIPSLKVLNLAKCKGLVKLVNHKQSKLMDLNLSHCCHLRELGGISGKNMKHINLFMCRNIPSQIISQIFENAHVLEQVCCSGCTQNIQTLNIASPSLRTFVASGCSSLFRASIHSKTLEEIDFSGCRQLRELDVVSSSLHRIILSNCVSLSSLRLPWEEMRQQRQSRSKRQQIKAQSKLISSNGIPFNLLPDSDFDFFVDIHGCTCLSPDLILRLTHFSK